MEGMSVMRALTTDGAGIRPVVTDIVDGYAAARRRVDDAYRRMQQVEAAGHTPADARAAAYALTAALREATAAVTAALRRLDSRPPAARHRLDRRPTATRSDSPDVAALSAELVRLAQIGWWLRRTTLDDPGVHVPTTLRVASYAATSPDVAGLDCEPELDRNAPERLIGVDLTTAVDDAVTT
jgi:hypothetical protein